ncbi:site-specific integrase [Hymenobacter sp. 15J16-1T3B]|uniref:site-specific integrase n=1 Tax=Hymenobacter sp. 15J16-1T3B TaxID=2886941 RepID=UPI001D0FAFC5|nr:site-specific integrase [Hymenobacter sp. 15J16-1T3B]
MKVRFVYRPSEGKTAAGSGAILCRITVDKQRQKFTTPVTCLRRDWDATRQTLKGNGVKARQDNGVLSKIRTDIEGIYYLMERNHELVTAEGLLDAYLKRDQPRVTLAAATLLWHEQRHLLVGKTITKASYDGYRRKTALLLQFLAHHGMPKALPDMLTESVAEQFVVWMRSHQDLSQNYTGKTVQVVKQLLKWCKRYKYAATNPLEDFAPSFEPTKAPLFLSRQDVQRLHTHVFAADALRRVADVFLFQCYTGLAYADLKRFDVTRDVGLNLNGEVMIYMGRQKTQHSTGQQATIPLLKPAKELLQKYGNQLPVPTNQVYNRMLKEVATVAGLAIKPEQLTTHIGRKTAGRLWLDAGVSIAAVSKALGHRTIAMTEQYYVRAGEDLVSREFNKAFGDAETDAA